MLTEKINTLISRTINKLDQDVRVIYSLKHDLFFKTCSRSNLSSQYASIFYAVRLKKCNVLMRMRFDLILESRL